MKLDELAVALFPGEHALKTGGIGATGGTATTAARVEVGIFGISNGEPVGVDAAATMSKLVFNHVARQTAPDCWCWSNRKASGCICPHYQAV